MDEMEKCFRRLSRKDFSDVRLGEINIQWNTQGYYNEVGKQLEEQGWTADEYVKEFKSPNRKGKVTPEQILLAIRCRKTASAVLSWAEPILTEDTLYPSFDE